MARAEKQSFYIDQIATACGLAMTLLKQKTAPVKMTRAMRG